MKAHEIRAQEIGCAPKSTLVLCFSCWRRLLRKSTCHSLTSFLSHPHRTVADMDGLINSYCTCSYDTHLFSLLILLVHVDKFNIHDTLITFSLKLA